VKFDWIGLLQIIFILLKVIGVVEWSWWWVLSPTWISAGIVIVIFLIFVAINIFKKEKKR